MDYREINNNDDYANKKYSHKCTPNKIQLNSV